MEGEHNLALGVGIEDTFVPQNGPGERAIDEYELTEHYMRWREDVDLIADVNARFVRWGVPWYRVNPRPGSFDFSWCDGPIHQLAENGITVILDLLHYGCPTWLSGEFAAIEFPRYFAEFAGAVAERYRDLVSWFTPINEPAIHILFCGEYGYWPPYLRGVAGARRLTVAIARAARAGQQAIWRASRHARIVHVEAGMRYVGALAEHQATVARYERLRLGVEDLLCGLVDPAHPLYDELQMAGMDATELAEFAQEPTPPDVIGINYYPRHSSEVFEVGIHHLGGFADPRPTVDCGLAGLRDLLTHYFGRYGRPLMISETSVTGSESERIAWMDASLAEVEHLRSAGLPILGYTWWPLFDMYEWTYRHSAAPRRDHLLSMGLYRLEETPRGLARCRTPVADRYAHHAALRHSSSKGQL